MKKINGENQKLLLMMNFNLNINLEGKFITERGRINCSLREDNGFYRWFGYSICYKRKINY